MNYTAKDFQSDVKNVIAEGTKDIKVEHPGILGVPDNFMKEKSVGDIVKRMITRAKSQGKSPIMHALNNLVRWNKNDNKSFSKKMQSVVDNLKDNKDWQAIPSKSK